MKSRRISEMPQTYVLIFDKNDDVMENLRNFADQERLSAAQLSGIGAFNEITIGFFDCTRKGYKRIHIDEFVEVLSLLGDVAMRDGVPEIHCHVVVGKSDGTAHGGHLLDGHVWPTLEIIVTESPAYLRRKVDFETGLALIELDQTLEREEGDGLMYEGPPACESR
jgi:uncharacterized protein